MSNIEGKVIVITGASSGLGLVAAKELANRGAKVVVGARRLDRLQTLVKELGQPKETAVEVDVTKPEEVGRLIKAAVGVYGRIDVLVNNAGYLTLSNLEDGHVDEWEKCIDINIKGVLYGVNAVLPVFREQRFGQIINVSSVAGHTVFPFEAVYSGTKFAVRAISEGLRQELKPYNVRVLNVSPGAIETEMLKEIVDRKTSDQHAAAHVSDWGSMPATAFSDALIYAIGQPENVDVNEIIFRPTHSA